MGVVALAFPRVSKSMHVQDVSILRDEIGQTRGFICLVKTIPFAMWGIWFGRFFSVCSRITFESRWALWTVRLKCDYF